MTVRDVMTTKVVVVTPETVVPQVMRLSRERGIRHLVVVERRPMGGSARIRPFREA